MTKTIWGKVEVDGKSLKVFTGTYDLNGDANYYSKVCSTNKAAIAEAKEIRDYIKSRRSSQIAYAIQDAVYNRGFTLN